MLVSFVDEFQVLFVNLCALCVIFINYTLTPNIWAELKSYPCTLLYPDVLLKFNVTHSREKIIIKDMLILMFAV